MWTDDFRNLLEYSLYMQVPIIGQCGADNRYVPIIGRLRYMLSSNTYRKNNLIDLCVSSQKF